MDHAIDGILIMDTKSFFICLLHILWLNIEVKYF